MTCSDFIERFSEYYDGTGDPALVAEADDHAAACEDCRRYRAVVSRGAQVLRSFPAIEVSDDFLPRLQHRLYHLEDGEALAREAGAAASATTAMTAFGIALVLAAAAWSPMLLAAPEVDLPPIVVSRPEPRPVGLRMPSVRFLPAGRGFVPSSMEWGLWDDANVLLTRYSPLTGRSGSAALLRRTDLD